MQIMRSLPLALVWAVRASAQNPLGTALQLIDELAAKVTKDGEAEERAYQEFRKWCSEAGDNAGFAIQTAEKSKARLEAKLGELSSDIEEAGTQIEELAASIAKAQKELTDATTIRKKEAADFATSEGELVDAIDSLGRAVGVLSKEMGANPASFAQLDTGDVTKIMTGLSAVLDAASFPSNDKAKLVALVQSQQGEDADDLEPGAPAGAAYKTHSGGILDVLEDMKEKADGQLSDLRKAEVNSRHNFEMLREALTEKVAAETKDKKDENAGKSNAEEGKAAAEGDLEVTTKDLASSKQELVTTKGACTTAAADHEASVAARKEELAAIAEAKKILQETSSGAVSETYSLLQASSSVGLQSGGKLVMALKKLARKHHSAALAQLASRIASVLRRGSGSGDQFGKVKGLIESMIAKLEKEAGDEATEKAYCDEEMAKTEAKEGDLNDDIAKLTSRIDQRVAQSAQLQQEVKALESELAALTKEQAELDTIRQDEKVAYTTAKADLELGLSGVRKAIDALRSYYGGSSAAMIQDENKFGAFMQQPSVSVHSKSQGAGDSIISILEVCESDFATNLAKEESEESAAQSEYEKITQENAVTKTAKEGGVKGKTSESKSLAKTVAEFSSDRESADSELSAVLEYSAKLKARCIAKPEAYADRKARREAEIAGLKDALAILEDETALVQRKRRGSFRGTLAAM